MGSEIARLARKAAEGQFQISRLKAGLSLFGAGDLPLEGLAFASLALSAACAVAAVWAVLAAGSAPLCAGLLLLALASLRIPSACAALAKGAARKSMERELPVFLSQFNHLLELGLTPVSALERAAAASRGGPLGSVVRGAILEARKGMPLERALDCAAERIESEKLDEAFAAASSVLAEGSSREARELVGRTARRQAAERAALLERYSAKSQAVAVLAIATTALLPAVCAFILATARTRPIVPVIAFLIVFPVLSAAEFAYVVWSAP